MMTKLALTSTLGTLTVVSKYHSPGLLGEGGYGFWGKVNAE